MKPHREQRARSWHYVKPNETTRVPRRHIFLDTEAAKEVSRHGEEQTWALAVACFRSQRPDRKPQERWLTFDDPELLWKEVSVYCGESGRTVLWTHNLGYDARISDVFTLLPMLGWHLVAHNLIGKGTWLNWRRGRATLVMVDSASIFPTRLDRIGTLVGLPKLRMPEPAAHGVGLYSRCWRDVEIMRKAVLDYLQWIEEEDLGNWQLTGAGQSWAAFRHRFMDRRLLVHDDTDALGAERRAMWTGRCEAYWHGELGFQVVHEWDLSLAYARIARDVNVPVRLLGEMPDDYDWRRQLASVGTAILAECTVSTDVPVVPTQHDGRILWPVGTFTTTLWDVEIRAAIEAGATVTVHKGWLYHKAPALKAWATWVIDQIEHVTEDDIGLRYLVLKHWSRALIGRFGMTYTKWEEWARAPFAAVRAMDVYDRGSEATSRTVQIGQTIWRDAGVEEWGESMPMVTGYVQAVCRVRLWTVLSLSPVRSVLYADTDSVLVPDMHSAAIAEIAARHADWGLRLKRSWDGFAIWGPRQIRTGNMTRVSGVSRFAERADRTHFAGEVWQSLNASLHTGNESRVVVRHRVWEIKGVDFRRDGPPIGWTHPRRLPHTGRSNAPPTEEEHHGQQEPRGPGGRGARGRASGRADPPGRTAGRVRRPAPGRGPARPDEHPPAGADGRGSVRQQRRELTG